MAEAQWLKRSNREIRQITYGVARMFSHRRMVHFQLATGEFSGERRGHEKGFIGNGRRVPGRSRRGRTGCIRNIYAGQIVGAADRLVSFTDGSPA